jgi:hypothetical protein
MVLRSGQCGDLLLVAELSLGEGSDSVARARVSAPVSFRVSVCRRVFDQGTAIRLSPSFHPEP